MDGRQDADGLERYKSERSENFWKNKVDEWEGKRKEELKG